MMVRRIQPQAGRHGTTLIEVVTAIFIMGIGLLSLLTLFPIGILTMRQAIQDDRTAHASRNAVAIAQAFDIRHDPSILPWYKNPNPGDAALADAQPGGPSWAVFADPIGTRSFATVGFQQWVGGQNRGVRRSSVSFATSNQLVWRWFTSLDDLVFDFDGVPEKITPNRFRRGSVYSWAYLLRQPDFGQPGIVDMTVVVYDERPTAMNNATQAGEIFYQAAFGRNSAGQPAEQIITVQWNAATQPPPAIDLGDWILDTTPVPLAGGKFGPSHAAFYRVVGFTQTAANQAELEVQQEIRGFPLPPPTPPALANNGTIVVLDGIAEVYPLGTGWYP